MKNRAFSLIECMVTLVLLMITISAVMSFRCYTVSSAQKAETQLLAARAAQLFCESWKAQEGDPAFDPLNMSWEPDFVVTAYDSENQLPAFTGNYAGSFTVNMSARPFDAHLYYEDDAGANMRTLHVIVTWIDARGNSCQFHLPTLTSI